MSAVHLCHLDLLIHVITSPMLTPTIGCPTPIKRNLSSQNSSSPRIKCRQVILISWWRSGRRMVPNRVMNPPFIITRISTIQLMPLTSAMSPGNHLTPVTMARCLRNLKSHRGWNQSILFGFVTHAFSSAIYYQTPTSRMLLTPRLTRSMTQRITTDTMTSCQAIGHGGMR